MQTLDGDRTEAVITAWRPRHTSREAAAFAREVVSRAAPSGPTRARTLLWCCARLGDFGIGVGLAPKREILLHPSVIERFVTVGLAHAPPERRRDIRSHLRFVARRVAPDALEPDPAPLGRTRAKTPYSPAEVASFLALADAQSSPARRDHRIGALLCCGLGAGCGPYDLRTLTGSDVISRRDGVVLRISGARARAVPVLATFCDRLVDAAAFCGDAFLIGGVAPTRRNVTNRLVSSLAGGIDLPRIECSRLRATWLSAQAEALGLPGLFYAAGFSSSQQLGDVTATLPVPGEDALIALLGEGAEALIALGVLEAVLDDPVLAGRVATLEAALPSGVRPRQLGVRTLLLGMLVVLADHRPAHLRRVHAALVGLPAVDHRRLGVRARWRTGEHLLTYRQTEYTFSLVAHALAKARPDGSPSVGLAELLDALMEASVPDECRRASSAVAVDWSDLESFSRPPTGKGGSCSDPEASWGRRHGHGPGQKDELFFGYYFQLATMVKDEGGDVVPELVRRVLTTSCHVDPPRAFVPVLERLVSSGVGLGDVCCDSGYAHRDAAAWALPLRALSAEIVTDLHPHDRGPKGTFGGAICHNGNLYCPATPQALFSLGPLPRDASEAEVAAHDTLSAELSRHKLGRISADDSDGHHRVLCPAVMGKLRCPLRPASMTRPHALPEVLAPPKERPACCVQQSLTVPAQVNAKTAQKHDYPSAAHRRSYRRRTAVERSNSRVKDPATTDVARGWCRVMGLVAISLFLASGFVVTNLVAVDAFAARRGERERRINAGLAPRSRRRRRTTIADLVSAANAPPESSG